MYSRAGGTGSKKRLEMKKSWIKEAREMKKDIIEFIWLFIGSAACVGVLIEIGFRGIGL